MAKFDRLWSCERKRPMTKREAANTAWALRRQGARVKVYSCPFGDHYHVANLPRPKRRK